MLRISYFPCRAPGHGSRATNHPPFPKKILKTFFPTRPLSAIFLLGVVFADAKNVRTFPLPGRRLLHETARVGLFAHKKSLQLRLLVHKIDTDRATEFPLFPLPPLIPGPVFLLLTSAKTGVGKSPGHKKP